MEHNLLDYTFSFFHRFSSLFYFVILPQHYAMFVHYFDFIVKCITVSQRIPHYKLLLVFFLVSVACSVKTMRNASCTATLQFGPLAVFIRTAAQGNSGKCSVVRKVQGLRRDIGRFLKWTWRKHWGCWSLLYHNGFTSVFSWPTQWTWRNSSRHRCLINLSNTKTKLNYT